MKMFIQEIDYDAATFKEVESVQLNGYHVGDRLLEGLMFDLKVVDNRITVTCADPYFQDLNTTKWLIEVENFAKDHDLFGENDDFMLLDTEKPLSEQNFDFDSDVADKLTLTRLDGTVIVIPYS